MTALRTRRPPDDFRLVRRWVVESAHELSHLRSSLHEAITGEVGTSRGDFSKTPDRMVLVASELATNALRHAKAPRSVQLYATDEQLLLDVVDEDVSTVPEVAGVRPPGEGGFGLKLAQRLASDVGWYASGSTKHVWASFPASPRQSGRNGRHAQVVDDGHDQGELDDDGFRRHGGRTLRAPHVRQLV